MPSEARPSICPACGRAFGCGAGTGRCWCVQVEVPEERLHELAPRYDGCLCPGCLAGLASPPASTPEVEFVGPRPT